MLVMRCVLSGYASWELRGTGHMHTTGKHKSVLRGSDSAHVTVGTGRIGWDWVVPAGSPVG